MCHKSTKNCSIFTKEKKRETRKKYSVLSIFFFFHSFPEQNNSLVRRIVKREKGEGERERESERIATFIVWQKKIE